MTRYIRTAVILFLICAVCTALCALVNEITAPRIAANVEGDRITALQDVSAGYSIGDEVAVDEGGINYYIPLTDGSELAGYIVEMATSGYGGAMTVIASYSIDGSVLQAKLMADSETPGLGKKAEEAWYMEMFQGLGGSEPLPESKSDLSAENNAAVSGASITFSGVSSALINGSQFVKGLGGAV
ncbi:MAG: FMN-binding protein [Spirochaetes bacterium]|uniref:FMN-binding protein n=1 Tax=Candidatus Ornithospirochaeta stercoripullorum TaxID=2840899 RepID=A0A9D9E313_9SPIO|nr:FMN-binding protein [Candidatus Ornithospirochaeta stercoripullorum]